LKLCSQSYFAAQCAAIAAHFAMKRSQAARPWSVADKPMFRALGGALLDRFALIRIASIHLKMFVRVACLDTSPLRNGMVAACAAVYYPSRAQLWSPQHDVRGCFDLRRNCSFVRGDSGMDRASLDPKALSAQKPERPALHRCRYHTDCKCGNWSRGRFANRGGTGLHGVGSTRRV
jgi:hypothetical protein